MSIVTEKRPEVSKISTLMTSKVICVHESYSILEVSKVFSSHNCLGRIYYSIVISKF